MRKEEIIAKAYRKGYDEATKFIESTHARKETDSLDSKDKAKDSFETGSRPSARLKCTGKPDCPMCLKNKKKPCKGICYCGDCR